MRNAFVKQILSNSILLMNNGLRENKPFVIHANVSQNVAWNQPIISVPDSYRDSCFSVVIPITDYHRKPAAAGQKRCWRRWSVSARSL